ncbi:unnamed protein product [Closterium sp. NIES-54]
MKRLSVAAFLLVALAVAARVPSASGAGWVELDLTQTGEAGDAALAQRAAGIALEKYNTQTSGGNCGGEVQRAVGESLVLITTAVIRVTFTAREQESTLRRLLREQTGALRSLLHTQTLPPFPALLFSLLLQNSALALAAVQSAEVFVPADVGRKAMIRVAFTASEQEGALRRFLRGPDSTLAVKAEIAGTSHELHHYKLESFRTSG